MKSKKHTSRTLISFYKTFEEIKDNKYDGLIITGAPVEKLRFEDVDYWLEMEKILEWSKTHVFSSFLFVGLLKQHCIIFMVLRNMN
mgnify:CR=1 FL=1